jgi:hypothetical protein
MLTQFQTQCYLVLQHFKLKPYLNDKSEVFYALLSFLYRNITFLKQSHKKRKEKKRKKIKKICSFKILYCNKSQILTSILQVYSLLVSMNEAPFSCVYSVCMQHVQNVAFCIRTENHLLHLYIYNTLTFQIRFIFLYWHLLYLKHTHFLL